MNAASPLPSSPAAPASSAATWSISARRAAIAVRVIDNLVGGRAANLAQHQGESGSRLLRAATSAQLEPDVAALRRRELRLPLRRHRRHRALDRAADSNTWTPTCRAPCTCSNARARRASRSSSTRPRRPATASPRRRPREDHPIAPQYPYALSKYQGEQAAFHWHRVYRLPVNSIRIFNAYGTRVRTTGAYGAVFGVFFRQKLAGKPFTVVGDGTQRRDFVYVTDVARGLSGRGRDAISGRESGTSAPAIRSRSTGWSSCSAARWCTCPSARASPTAPGPTSRRSRAISAGSRASRSRRACGGCWPRSTTGATRRCGIRTRIAEATKTWFEYLGKQSA